MASVGYCSISSSNQAFMSVKTKSSSPNCDMISRRDDSVVDATDANDVDKIHTPPPVKARSSPNCDMISRRDDSLAVNYGATGGYLSLEDDEMEETQTVVDSGDSEYYPSDADDAEAAHGIGIDKSTRIFPRRYAETASRGRRYAETPCRGSAAFFIINSLCPHTITIERHDRRLLYDDLQTSIEYVFIENRSFPNSVMKHNNENNLVILLLEGQYRLAIVESISYRVFDEHMNFWDGVIDCWVWTPSEDASYDQLKIVFESAEWDDIKDFFRRESIYFGESEIEVYFVNQVAGPSFHRGSRQDVKNKIDGAVQCSALGVDIFYPPVPHREHIRDSNIQRSVNSSITEDFFYSEYGDKIQTMRYNRNRVDNSVHQHKFINGFIRFKHAVQNWDAAVNYHTISHVDGSEISGREMTTLPSHLKDKFFVPSPSSSNRFDDWVKFYVLTKDSLSDIKKKYHGKSAKNICSDLEKDLRLASDSEVSYFVLNTRVHEDTDEREVCNAIVYAGASAPPEVTYTATNDKDYWEYYLDAHQDIVYRQLWDGGGKFDHHPPISVSYRSRFTQPRQFDYHDIKLFQKGVNNNRGTFPVRKSVGIMGGSNSYFGYRRKHCVTMPTVSQGPGVLAQYQYNRQFVDCLYLVFILRVLNAVGQFTSNSMRFFWKHLHVSSVFRHSPTWICGLHILTLNFYNSPHVDNDTMPYDKQDVLNELNAVIDCDDVNVKKGSFKYQADLLYKFVDEYNCPTPTTCCYQLIQNEKSPDSSEKLQCHYYFLNCGINSCHRIYDHMTMSFCGSVFQHCTSVPVFISEKEDGTSIIHIGDHPSWTWLAWGAGNNDNSASAGGMQSQSGNSNSNATNSNANSAQRGRGSLVQSLTVNHQSSPSRNVAAHLRRSPRRRNR